MLPQTNEVSQYSPWYLVDIPELPLWLYRPWFVHRPSAQNKHKPHVCQSRKSFPWPKYPSRERWHASPRPTPHHPHTLPQWQWIQATRNYKVKQKNQISTNKRTLIASIAYSIWKRRPSGEKVFTPRSYSDLVINILQDYLVKLFLRCERVSRKTLG